jgi:crotonobetainyl-CoA:carnitine CoA-transferase CaiB-like acyl-CoA transferase
MRPGVAARLGIDYESLRKINPQLVYCSVSGYGQDGPYREWPAHDLSYQGVAGILNIAPRDSQGAPLMHSVAMADLSAGMFATIGILNALLAREKMGFGQYIDVSMTDGLVSWMSVPLGLYFGAGPIGQSVMEPAFGVFATKDGNYVTLSIAHEDYFWRNLCLAIGKEEVAELPRAQRLQGRDELAAMLKSVLLTRTREEWVKLLTEANVPWAPVLTMEEVGSDLHLRYRGVITEVDDPRGG